ncbi:hypothetical protein F5878DRAFT_666689 [Lentinula raphanica]|uniref:F-box domain-containing protein n=1 Tax=Lentinula raphanica TaxID=153919 RepID=A0AA38NX90_9AGAR|nr:hypothetical protein F5878DRAFT_666689 [Lentinula raphanica]
MAIAIPQEIVDCILNNLHSEKPTLSNCALVRKSWTASAQRGLFQHIILRFPDPYYRESIASELATAYNKRNEQLIEIFERKPFLMACVRTLELEQFAQLERFQGQLVPESLVRRKERLVTSTTKVLKRLHNLESLLLLNAHWDSLSLELREALMHLFNQLSLTRITLSFFQISSFQDLASLLSQASNLKILNIHFSCCYNWELPTTPLINRPPRLIQLDHSLSLLSYNDIAPFLSWFQHDSCPFETRNLRSLKVNRIDALNDVEFASMLQYTGGNLQDLILQGPFPIQPSSVLHIGQLHNLQSLTILETIQTAVESPVPWILGLFRHLPESERETSPLRRLTISLLIDCATIRWARRLNDWTVVNMLFTQRRFALLECVKIELLGRSLPVLRDIKSILIKKMSSLEGAGKLEVEIAHIQHSQLQQTRRTEDAVNNGIRWLLHQDR